MRVRGKFLFRFEAWRAPFFDRISKNTTLEEIGAVALEKFLIKSMPLKRKPL